MVLNIEIYNKFQYFSQDERRYLQKVINVNASANINDRQEYILIKIWRSVDADTTQYQKDMLIDLVERLYIERVIPALHIAHRGENIIIDIKLNVNDDFTNTILLARENETKLPLSADDVLGTSEPVQSIIITDIDLVEATFYKILLLLEVPDNNEKATGNAEALINEVYLYIVDDIDSD